MKIGAIIVTLLVLIHHVIAYQHGGAHEILAIPMALWQTAFINVVILVLPLIGIVLVWTKWQRLGYCAVLIGAFGALAFGVLHHYMWTSPDHISHLPDAEAHVHGLFIWSAGMIAMLEGAAGIAAGIMLGITARRD